MTSTVPKLGLLMCVLLAALSWAQNHAAVQTENRTATEPQIGYAAQNGSENNLLGCISGSKDNLLLVQEQEKRTYRLHGAESQLTENFGKLVKVTGRIVAGQQPSVPSVQVTAVQVIAQNCGSPSAAGKKPEPVSGKTGNAGAALPVTDTSSAGQVTPGAETQAGRAQAPGRRNDPTAAGMPRPPNPTGAQGAPAAPEQVAQNPVDAGRIADAARQVEMSTPRPPSAETGDSHPGQTKVPQASNAGQGEATSTLVGCLASSGHGFWLREQTSGTRHRLQATASQMKEHLNHLVQVAVRPVKGQGAVSSGNEEVLEVTAVQDLAPTCSAQHRQ